MKPFRTQASPIWGGKRKGAGRPSTGRTKKTIYVTDTEYDQVKSYIEKLRSDNMLTLTLTNSAGFIYKSEGSTKLEAIKGLKPLMLDDIYRIAGEYIEDEEPFVDADFPLGRELAEIWQQKIDEKLEDALDSFGDRNNWTVKWE